MKKFRVGLVGCGRIGDIYLKTCQQFEELEVVACASLDIEESRQKATQYDISKACTPDEIFGDPQIDCVLNLTIPTAHAEISLAALKSGKHVYSEKPFVTDIEDAKKILALAAARRLCVGSAPDTFLGGRLQTCRKLMDDGVIGVPTGVASDRREAGAAGPAMDEADWQMAGPASGPESTHPDRLHGRRRQDLFLPPVDRCPELIVDDPQRRDLLDDPLLRRVGPGEPLAGLRVLDIALQVPDEAARIKLVVDEAIARSPAFREAFATALRNLWRDGTKATLRDYVAGRHA